MVNLLDRTVAILPGRFFSFEYQQKYTYENLRYKYEKAKEKPI